jgi:protein TonB
MDRGSVGVSIRVTPDGRATNCRIVRSSGSPVADSLMCQLTEEYVRFRPALDAQGRPIAQDVTWYPNWYRR